MEDTEWSDGDDVVTEFIDEESPRKFFTQIPNIIDDLGLSVYAVRLYLHMKRRAGENPKGRCFEGGRKMAKLCGMADGQISKAKHELANHPMRLISIKQFDRSTMRPDEIRIRDIWRDNSDHYTKGDTCSPHEQGVQDTNRGVHVVNSKKNLSEEEPLPDSRPSVGSNKPLSKNEKRVMNAGTTGLTFADLPGWSQSLFDTFFAHYPKMCPRTPSEEAYVKLHLTYADRDTLLPSLEIWARAWKQDQGADYPKYVPTIAKFFADGYHKTSARPASALPVHGKQGFAHNTGEQGVVNDPYAPIEGYVFPKATEAQRRRMMSEADTEIKAKRLQFSTDLQEHIAKRLWQTECIAAGMATKKESK